MTTAKKTGAAGTKSSSSSAASKSAGSKTKTPAEPAAVIVDDTEGDTAEPVEPVESGKFYCPGCGRQYDVEADCVGGELPHPPIPLAKTSELSGPPEKHTPAPPSE